MTHQARYAEVIPRQSGAMMKNLVLLSHPNLAMSLTHRALVEAIADLPDIKIHHLERMYPDGEIDVLAEQEACAHARRIVWQFPLFWHACPAMLKRWQDEVLTPGWAYGAQHALAGKTLQVVTSSGDDAGLYAAFDRQHYPLEDLLLPLKATACGLGLHWAPPLLLAGVDRPEGIVIPAALNQSIEQFAAAYTRLMQATD